MISEMTNAE